MAVNEVYFQDTKQTIIINGISHGESLIEELSKQEPKRKSSPEHRNWSLNMNALINAVNRIAGYKKHILKK